TSGAKHDRNLATLTRLNGDPRLQHRARIVADTSRFLESWTLERCWIGGVAIPSEKFTAIGSVAFERFAHAGKCDDIAEQLLEGVLREERLVLALVPRANMMLRVLALHAARELRVAGDLQLPGPSIM